MTSARSREPAPATRAPVPGAGDARNGLLLPGIVLGAASVLALPMRGRRSRRRSRPPGGAGEDIDWEATLGRLERPRSGPPRLSGRPGAGIGSRGSSAPSAGARDREAVTRRLSLGAAAISFSVLADSAAEHYRGGFHHPVMYVAPAVSALALLASASLGSGPRRVERPRDALFGAAVLTGLAGLGFHARNTSRRIGGWSWENLFYGPPVAAPLGLAAAGLLGMAALRVRAAGDRPPLLLGLPGGRVIAAGAATGLLGTAVEAGILHFRGAFHRPAMYVPVSVPPLAALALALAALDPSPGALRLAGRLLRATALAGVAGMGFHAHGIGRSMGGWRNWSQNLLAGPPLPAPPSFTGMALAGLAGLSLLREEAR